MVQEYLLHEPTDKSTINSYKPQGIKKRFFSADNGNCRYVQFSCDGENEDTARRLSAVDEYIRTNFHVTVLEDGCSAYFNRRLYPLISGFELKLRKLLYLASAVNHDEETSEIITDLESKDLGQIFTMLFIDTSFMGRVKDDVKKRNQEIFTKESVLAAINDVEENTLWDQLIGKNSVPSLYKQFTDVRNYRNDVMHSQATSWKRFQEMQHLYRTINKELDEALHKIEVVDTTAFRKPSFNQILGNALRAQEMYASLTSAVAPAMEELRKISEMYTQDPAYMEAIKNVRKYYSTLIMTSELQNTINQIVSQTQPPPDFLKSLGHIDLGQTENNNSEKPTDQTDDNDFPEKDSE